MGGIPVWLIVVIGVIVFIALVNILAKRSAARKERKQKEETYQRAIQRMNSGDYDRATTAFESLGDYRDSAALRKTCREKFLQTLYDRGVRYLEAGDYDLAKKEFVLLNAFHHKDAPNLLARCHEGMQRKKYEKAVQTLKAGQYQEAVKLFDELAGYADSRAQKQIAQQALDQQQVEKAYAHAQGCLKKQDYSSAIYTLKHLPQGYKDRDKLLTRAYDGLYQEGVREFEQERYQQAKHRLEDVPSGFKEREYYLSQACRKLYGSDFCADSPTYKHVWENLSHIVVCDNELRKIGHGRRRCRCCSKEEDFSYDYDTDGY